MVNFNIYVNIEESGDRGQHHPRTGRIRRRSRTRRRRSIRNELYGAAIAQTLEQNLPFYVNAGVWHALTTTPHPNQGHDQPMHPMDLSRTQSAVLNLHAVISRNLQHNLNGLIRHVVMTALQTNQEQGAPVQGQEQLIQVGQPIPEEWTNIEGE